MGTKNKVIRLERNGPNNSGLTPMELDAVDFQSALPEQNLHLYFSDEKLGINVGIWDTTTMQEAFGPYPGDEFVWVLEGQFEMVDADGNSVAAKSGDSVCFRNGAPMSWKQEGYLRKFFITFLDPKASPPEIKTADGAVIVMDQYVPLEKMEDTDPFTIVGERPIQKNHTVFTNDTGNMFIGVWDSGPMQSKMEPFPTHEFVQMLEGSVTISEPGAEPQTFKAGDCFFVPKSTVCSWKIDQYVKKYYAILEI